MRSFILHGFVLRAIVASCVVFCGFLSVSAQAETATKGLRPGPTYRGMCDASAAVAVDEERFLVANDEDNILRLYHRDHPDKVIGEFDVGSHLAVEPNEPESDMEGACVLGRRAYWITSHGRNKKDKVRQSRCRLFATEASGSGDDITVSGVGKVYSSLLEDLTSDPRLARYLLAEASELAPKKEGALNIEGLAATPTGQLLVAFRNPLRGGKALIVPIENPTEVIDGGKRARLGAPIDLSLSPRGSPLGIRAIEYDPTKKSYLIIAGSFEGGGKFALYDWPGGTGTPRPKGALDFGNLNPEAVFVYPGETRRVQFLSDDGATMVGNKECKKLNDETQRTFRSAFLEE